jgi:hypothetical protein
MLNSNIPILAIFAIAVFLRLNCNSVLLRQIACVSFYSLYVLEYAKCTATHICLDLNRVDAQG